MSNIRIFYAEKDATLYEHKDTTNTGLDEILSLIFFFIIFKISFTIKSVTC